VDESKVWQREYGTWCDTMTQHASVTSLKEHASVMSLKDSHLALPCHPIPQLRALHSNHALAGCSHGSYQRVAQTYCNRASIQYDCNGMCMQCNVLKQQVNGARP